MIFATPKIHVLCAICAVWMIVASCTRPDYYHYPLQSKNGNTNAVIEIPAGSNHKVEYDTQTRTFPVEMRDGKPRVVKFLPYPGNYGFLPSTYMDPARGGDGDPLDVLVIAEAVPSGTVMEIFPVAVLHLRDDDEADDKILAVPADPAMRVVDAQTYNHLKSDYPAILDIVEQWFTSYKGPNKTQSLGWEGEEAAQALIKKWQVEGLDHTK